MFWYEAFGLKGNYLWANNGVKRARIYLDNEPLQVWLWPYVSATGEFATIEEAKSFVEAL